MNIWASISFKYLSNELIKHRVHSHSFMRATHLTRFFPRRFLRQKWSLEGMKEPTLKKHK